MGHGVVRLEVDGVVARMTVDNQDARNAMTDAMYDELFDHCRTLTEHGGIRVSVLRGAGGQSFVSGADVRELGEYGTAEGGLRLLEREDRVVGAVAELPMPTIAVIEGYALGGGLNLAAACDVRICTPTARIGMPMARTVANCLSMAGYARLVALIGAVQTKRLVFLAELRSAEDCIAMGLVDEVVEPERLDDRVDELVRRLEKSAPLTLWATKEALRRLESATIPDGDDIAQRVYASEDFRAGVEGFLTGQLPSWHGR